MDIGSAPLFSTFTNMTILADNTVPWIDYEPLNNRPRPLTLENMDFVNNAFYYLSVADPAQEPRPDWYYSTYGKPDSTGFSGGNVTVIAVNKTEAIEPGAVDVFYFLFYSFNDGNDVGGQTYGNHVCIVQPAFRSMNLSDMHVILSEMFRFLISNTS